MYPLCRMELYNNFHKMVLPVQFLKPDPASAPHTAHRHADTPLPGAAHEKPATRPSQ